MIYKLSVRGLASKPDTQGAQFTGHKMEQHVVNLNTICSTSRAMVSIILFIRVSERL